MIRIKTFEKFNLMINEQKLYIYSRIFRAEDLFEDPKHDNDVIYSPVQISEWMKKYDFDKMAILLFVSVDKIRDDVSIHMRVSSKDFKNKNYFDTLSTGKDGILIPESEMIVGNDILQLFLFRKNSNDKNRARQLHGFKYESEMRWLNFLNKPEYTAHWDAEGVLSEKLFTTRKNEGKKIEFYDGSELNEIEWESLDNKYKENYFWNIKCIKKRNEIGLGAFTRIAGLLPNGEKDVDYVDKFIFNVCFYSGENKENRTEYFIFIDIDTWKKYLPQYDKQELMNMFSELMQHKLNGKRTKKSEQQWKHYRSKYSNITNDSMIKLRFKRDSKGQLRIQAAINYNNFKKHILKDNNYIKIS